MLTNQGQKIGNKKIVNNFLGCRIIYHIKNKQYKTYVVPKAEGYN